MSTSTRRAMMPSLAASLVLAVPDLVAGQSATARPASVALTVIVPSPAAGHLTSVDAATVLRRTGTALDIQAVVGVVDRAASKIEVRLGTGWSSESPRVLVRNPSGEFEPIGHSNAIVAATVPVSRSDARSVVQFRVESERPMSAAPLAIPVEYRVTVGHGDQIVVWSFPALLHVAATAER